MAALASVICAPGAGAQTVADTLTGLVRDTAGAPRPGAAVTVTRGPDRRIYRTLTDQAGRFLLVVDSGTGDYLVHVAAEGFVSVRRRVTRERQEQRFAVEFRMASASLTQLASVVVSATRRVAPRRGGEDPSQRTAATVEVDGAVSALSPAAGGDVLQGAATVPGIRLTAGGVEGLGTPAAQSLVTLNGLAFDGNELPRGVATRTRVTSTTWDVSRGGFSGIAVDVGLSPGGLMRRRGITTSFDRPWMQATDAAGRLSDATWSRTDLNMTASGPTSASDRWVYATGARVRVRSNRTAGLTDAPAAALAAAGVTSSQADSLLAFAAPLGLVGGRGSSGGRTDVQWIGRLDRRATDGDGLGAAGRALGFTGFASWRRDAGLGLSPLAAATSAADANAATAGVQVETSARTSTWLHESRAGLSFRASDIAARSTAPAALIRTVPNPGDETGAAVFGLGGSTVPASRSRTIALDATHSSSTYLSAGARHRLKMFGQVRVDGLEDVTTPSVGGTYEFRTISDFRNGVPSRFQRSVGRQVREGATANAVLAAGAVYAPSRFFSLEYGLRSDVGAFVSQIPLNDRLVASLGVRSTEAPVSFGVSPRIGFRWVTTGRASGGDAVASTDGVFGRQARGIIRGGLGEFRSFVRPDPLASVIATHRPGGPAAQLTCVGADIVTPDWQSLLAGNATASPCLGATVLAAGLPTAATVFSPAWAAPRSWRASLGWSGLLLGADVSIDGLASVSLHQPSSWDLNFSGRAYGQTGEGVSRPLFAPVGSFIPSTGEVRPGAWARDTTWGIVRELRSEGRSEAVQVTASALWVLREYVPVRLSYTLQQIRSLENGFDASTAGDPRTMEWAPSAQDIRHQVQLQGVWPVGPVNLSVFLNVLSGVPFTPLVLGDLNGDGRSWNDRPLIVRASTAGGYDPQDFERLLGSAPAHARRCLERSLGGVADRNSCRGPWSALLNAQASWSVRVPGPRRRVRLALFAENVLAGLDVLLHRGEPRGWGALPVPDATLAVARGFDPATRSVQLALNPFFGTTSPRHVAFRAPFRVTLDASVPLGRPDAEQRLERALRDGRTRPGPPLSEEQLRQRYRRLVPDPFGAAIREQDSLFLTRAQVAELAAAGGQWRQRVDSVWTDLAKHLASLGRTYDVRATLAKQEDAIDAAWNITKEAVRDVFPRVLTRWQMPYVPFPGNLILTSPPDMRIRTMEP